MSSCLQAIARDRRFHLHASPSEHHRGSPEVSRPGRAGPARLTVALGKDHVSGDPMPAGWGATDFAQRSI